MVKCSSLKRPFPEASPLDICVPCGQQTDPLMDFDPQMLKITIGLLTLYIASDENDPKFAFEKHRTNLECIKCYPQEKIIIYLPRTHTTQRARRTNSIWQVRQG